MSFIWMVGGQAEPYPVQEPPPPHKVHPTEPPQASEKVGEGSPGSPTPFPKSPGRDAYNRTAKQNRPRRQPAVTAAQIMSSPVATVERSLSLEKARDFLTERSIRHVLVIDPVLGLSGILSDRDLLRGTPHPKRDTARRMKMASPPKTVGEIMAKRVLTATPETPIREIARIMTEEKVGCLPILTPDRQVVGIVTVTDILRCVVNRAPFDLWI